MDDFADLILRAGLPAEDCCIFFDVHRTTVKRWLSGEIEAPTAVNHCLTMLAGEFPAFSGSRAFDRWRMSGQYLYNPEGERFTPGDISAIKRMYHYESALNAKIRQQDRKIAELQATIDDITPALPDNVINFPSIKAN